ncbi:MAG: hypothetical protein ACM30E_00915 [Nitrososphaerales archaeon]
MQNSTEAERRQPGHDLFRCKLPNRSEKIYCLAPGLYAYTISGEPPWNSINGELDVTGNGSGSPALQSG